MNKFLPIQEYCQLHKNGAEVVGALEYAFGYDEANKICEIAIRENKKIVLKTDKNKLDYLEYTLK